MGTDPDSTPCASRWINVLWLGVRTTLEACPQRSPFSHLYFQRRQWCEQGRLHTIISKMILWLKYRVKLYILWLKQCKHDHCWNLGINTLKIGRYNRAEPPNYIAEMELWCLVIDVFVAFWSFAYDFISSALRQTLQNTPYFLFLRLSTFFPKNNPSLSSYLREYQPHMNY